MPSQDDYPEGHLETKEDITVSCIAISMINLRGNIDMSHLQQGGRIVDQLVVLRADKDVLNILNILIKQ